MRWITHEAIGVTAYSIASLAYSTNNVEDKLVLLSIIPVAYFTSRLPDIIDNLFSFEHRTFSHSLLCWLCVSAAFYSGLYGLGIWLDLKYLPFPISALIIAFSLAYILHIFADAFTDNGVNFLWPYNRSRPRKPIYRLWFYTQSKDLENKITAAVYLISSIIWFYKLR